MAVLLGMLSPPHRAIHQTCRMQMGRCPYQQPGCNNAYCKETDLCFWCVFLYIGHLPRIMDFKSENESVFCGDACELRELHMQSHQVWSWPPTTRRHESWIHVYRKGTRSSVVAHEVIKNWGMRIYWMSWDRFKYRTKPFKMLWSCLALRCGERGLLQEQDLSCIAWSSSYCESWEVKPASISVPMGSHPRSDDLQVQFLLQKLQQNGEENRNISGQLVWSFIESTQTTHMKSWFIQGQLFSTQGCTCSYRP